MPKLAKLKATIGTAIYPFKGTAGLYTGQIGTDTGVTAIAEDEEDLPEYSVKELLQTGILRRVRAVVRRGDNTRTSLRLVVAKDKLATALDALNGNTVTLPNGATGTITSVGFPRRVTSRG